MFHPALRGALAAAAASLLLTAGSSLLLATEGHAATITLSQASSDATDPALLDAVLVFDVLGGDQLSLSITNDSDYTINQIFFNGSDDVTGVSLVSVSDGSDWAASTGPQGAKAGLFGSFDFAFSSDGNAEGVQSGASVTFLFDIAGSCADVTACAMTDFLGPGTFSTPPPATHLAQAAAKFVQGPGDDSAFAAANGGGLPPVGVPEPSALLLLGAGLGGLAWIAGRRARR